MRLDVLLANLGKEVFFAPQGIVQNILDGLSNGIDRQAKGTDISNATNSVTISKVNRMAVISIDGAMYKKDMSSMCMSVASYQQILNAIDISEKMFKDGETDKTLFRVTTPGGTVAGLDTVEKAIKNMSMPTITLAEDQCCSAGLYAFTATDKFYASEMTEIGSIGVVVHVENNKEDKSFRAITSRRAKNKSMDLSKEKDVDRLKDKLDVYEERFYSVIEKNTSFTSSQIQKEFNNGDTIMEDKALEIGFIDGIMSYEEIIQKESGNENTVPTASSDKPVENSKGENMSEMEFNQENFNILLEENKVLKAFRATAEGRLATSATALETAKMQSEDAKVAASKKLEATVALSYEALEVGATKEGLMEALSKDNDAEASKELLKSMSSGGAMGGDNTPDAKVSHWADYEGKK